MLIVLRGSRRNTAGGGVQGDYACCAPFIWNVIGNGAAAVRTDITVLIETERIRMWMHCGRKCELFNVEKENFQIIR